MQQYFGSRPSVLLVIKPAHPTWSKSTNLPHWSRRCDAGDASGLFNAARNIGGSLALAAISTLQDQRVWLHSRRLEETMNANSVAVQDYVTALGHEAHAVPLAAELDGYRDALAVLTGVEPGGVDGLLQTFAPVPQPPVSVAIADKVDRRVKHVLITDQGRAAAMATEPLRLDILKQVFGSLNEGEHAQLVALMLKLSKKLEAIEG